MLPNESLLTVLHFADYRTLVLAKLAGAPFLCVAKRFAAELACRRRFGVTFDDTVIDYYDVTIGAGGRIEYELDSQPSLAAACRELDAAIGPHAVEQLTFYDHTWNTPGFAVILEAAPSLKYAEAVCLHSPTGSTVSGNFEAFMSNFTGMKTLDLLLDYNVFRQSNWTFLRQESARELRRISVFDEDRQEHISRFAEELVRYCITLPRRAGGEPLELDFSKDFFPGAFGQQIIKMLKGSERALTFRMRTVDDLELMFDERDYTIDVDDSTTRYAFEKSGIVVEVDGSLITIQSGAKVPHTQPGTSGDV